MGIRAANCIAWTDEQIELLRAGFDARKSASTPALELNCGATRNAVIGKMQRLGLSRPSATPRTKANPKLTDKNGDTSLAARINNKVKREPLTLPAELPAADIPRRQRKSIFKLKQGHCRFPYNHPGEKDFFYCGGKALTGYSYCAFHHGVCFQPNSRRTG